MAAVVVDDFEAGVVEDVVIFAGEIGGDDPGDEGFDFADDDALDAGIEDKGAGGDACAAADDEDGAGLGMDQGGDMAQHALEAHVLGFGGSFDFAADVEIAGAVGEFGDGDGGVHAFADVEEFREVTPGRCV